MASSSSARSSSDALLNQDAMGAATSHESQPSEETADTNMADITEISDTIDTPTQRSSRYKAPKGIKRPFEEISEGDVEDEDEANPSSTAAQGESGSQQFQPSKRQLKRAGIAELTKAEYVYIGHHVDQPLLGVWARFKPNGELRTQGRQKNDRLWEELADWRSLISVNGRVKMENVKLDPAVALDYQGDVDILSHVQKTQLVKDYLSSFPAQEEQKNDIRPSESPEPVGNAHNDRDVDSYSGKKIFFEPSEILVGIYDDGADVFAKCFQRKRDKHPSLSFFARSISSRSKIHDKFAMHEWIDFDKKFWRGSIDETRIYLKTFFKAKPVVEENNQMLSRKLKSEAVPDKLRVPLDGSVGEGFDNVKAALDNVLVPTIVNDFIMPAIDNLQEEVGLLQVLIGEQEQQISDYRLEIKKQAKTITSLTTSNEKHKKRLADLTTENEGYEKRLADLENTVADLTPRHEKKVSELEKTIKGMKQQHAKAPGDLESIIRDRASKINSLEIRIMEQDKLIGELGAANQTPTTDASRQPMPQTAVPDVAAMQSRIKELEKGLKDANSANQAQARKLASLTPGLEDQKKEPAVIDQETAEKEKDDKIKALEEQIFSLQSDNALLKTASGTSSVQPLELYGLSFADKFKKLGEGVIKARDVYKERNGQKMRKNGVWMQQTRILQKAISVGGVYGNRDEEVDSVKWAVLTEGGKKKLVKHMSSKVLVDGEEYTLYDTMKETEEDPDDDDGC